MFHKESFKFLLLILIQVLLWKIPNIFFYLLSRFVNLLFIGCCQNKWYVTLCQVSHHYSSITTSAYLAQVYSFDTCPSDSHYILSKSITPSLLLLPPPLQSPSIFPILFFSQLFPNSCTPLHTQTSNHASFLCIISQFFKIKNKSCQIPLFQCMSNYPKQSILKKMCKIRI